MAKKVKFYAVKKGNKTGIFYSWEECQEAIKGFSGVEYKAFETEEEANAYLQDKDMMYEEYILPYLNNGTVVAFTDGSYNDEKQKYGSGVYIITPEDKRIELAKSGNNVKYVGLNNIIGEILAVLDAIDWAWKNGYESIAIFFDYEGLKKWANREWKANNDLTKFYQKKIAELKDIIHIEFIKVKAHSNNKYNDKADKLANSAVNENKILKDNNGNKGYKIECVTKDHVESLLHKLKEEIKNLEIQESSSKDKFIWTLKLDNKKLTISLFNNITLLVQGKLSNLFSYATTRIIEEIPCGDFIELLKSAYTMSIDKKQIEDKFQSYLPNLIDKKIPDELIVLLKQAIIFMGKSDRDSIDFTAYILPALRALEGILKLNLEKCNIEISKKQSFNMFRNQKLKEEYCKDISKNNIEKLENCYNCYVNNRHALVHVTIQDNTALGTVIIETKEKANHIIMSTLKVINDNFIS